MKSSNDIANLYKLLNQDIDSYHEIVRDAELVQVNERWPLLNAMQDADFLPPSVTKVPQQYPHVGLYKNL